jgi:predicted Zn-dependent protease
VNACEPVQLRQPVAEQIPSAATPKAAPPASAPGYAAQLQPSRLGWVTLPLWCIWVEPNINKGDAVSLRWALALNAALEEWQKFVPIQLVKRADDAQLRMWRRRPPLNGGRASNGRALLQLQQVQRRGQAIPRLEPLVDVLISPGQRQLAIQATALHELGHGFGLWGHSPDPGDVMAAVPTAQPRLQLSPRDRSTLLWLQAQPSPFRAPSMPTP